jgi:hypothetical protein
VITAPVEPRTVPTDIDPGQLLIKEARRKTRRRRLIVAVSLIIVAVVALSLVAVLSPSPSAPQTTSKFVAGEIPVCTNSSLRMSVQNGDGLHHGVELLTFANVSGSACKLSGYPVVKAILDSTKGPNRLDGMYAPAPPNSVKRAVDVQYAWAGGIDSGDTPLKSFVSPVIVLGPHTGVASSTLNWVDGPNGNATCPAFSDVDIDVGGGSVRRLVRPFEPLCYEFAVTPIVKGTTGSMFVKADYSKKANDLTFARDDASGLRAAAVTVYRELRHPRGFTFSEEMQDAESLQNISQNLTENSPWPQVNSSMAVVGHEGENLGNFAVMHLVQSAHSRDLSNEYLKLLANIKSLNKVLRKLS